MRTLRRAKWRQAQEITKQRTIHTKLRLFTANLNRRYQNPPMSQPPSLNTRQTSEFELNVATVGIIRLHHVHQSAGSGAFFNLQDRIGRIKYGGLIIGDVGHKHLKQAT